MVSEKYEKCGGCVENSVWMNPACSLCLPQNDLFWPAGDGADRFSYKCDCGEKISDVRSPPFYQKLTGHFSEIHGDAIQPALLRARNILREVCLTPYEKELLRNRRDF